MKATDRIRLRAAGILGCAILCMGSVTPGAGAQDDPPPVRELTDADYPRILNALQVAARAARENLHKRPEDVVSAGNELLRELEAHLEIKQGVASGRIDLLSYMREQTRRVYIPPGARYDAKCSSQAFEVILTFGIPAADHYARLAGSLVDMKAVTTAEAAVEFVKSRERSSNPSPGTRAADQAVAGALAFYKAKGFLYDTAKSNKHVHHLVWPDPGQDSVDVTVSEYNDRPTAALGLYPTCTHMATGPFISIGFSQGLGTTRQDSVVQEAEGKRAQVFERAGLDLRQIDQIVQLAEMARLDDALELDLDVMMQIPDAEVQRTTRIRKRNIVWYRRHAAVLGPLFEQAGYPPIPKDP